MWENLIKQNTDQKDPKFSWKKASLAEKKN